MSTFLMILFITLSVASAALFIYLRIAHVGLKGFWGKLVASLVFTISGFVALMLKGKIETYMLFILLGLMLGMIGDILLELKIIYRPHDHQYTNGGILSFSVSHVMYIVALTLLASTRNEILLPVFLSLAIGSVLATIILANCGSMGVDFGVHKMQASAYSFILCIDFVYAVALSFLIPTLWIVAVGLLFFLISDCVLSLIYWGNKNTNVLNIINLSTYYLAQILIMIFLFAV